VRITLNGEPRELPGPMTVTALLEHLGIEARVVAVELNRVVIRRARFGDTRIDDGAEIEIVAFVGGGSGGQRASGAAAARAGSWRARSASTIIRTSPRRSTVGRQPKVASAFDASPTR